MPPYNRHDAEKAWKAIPSKLDKGLKGAASRDFCALECLANDPLYAKPDSQKIFLLWEAKNLPTVEDENHNDIDGVKIETIAGFRDKHPWVEALFISNDVVRFPFNTWDTDQGASLSWYTASADLKKDGWDNRLLQLPRWSTASRSCLALIPQKVDYLDGIQLKEVKIYDRLPVDVKDYPSKPELNVPEWHTSETNRFVNVVKDPGIAASSAGITLGNARGKYRLYSVKTGVNYVGSKDETGAGKNRLEANCSLAMLRSEVIEAMPNNDTTFGVQTEVLTITAPLTETDKKTGKHPRDGFQVRDLSCMRPGLDYIPGQAIPYAREVFDRLVDFGTEEPKIKSYLVQKQCDFWREAFAVPLGRAKARLFLNYGLIHTSANAQNFLLGFEGSRLEQFVARDIGDTSWHDDYIGRYAMRTPLYSAFKRERKSPIRHLLHETSSGAYPPPHIVRLAAYSVLTHDFAKVLKEKNRWTDGQVYECATGILDGFRDFIQEAFGLGQLYPEKPGELDDSSIQKYGVNGKYPTGMGDSEREAYSRQVEQLLKESAVDLFARAARVRQRGKKAATGNNFGTFKTSSDDGICTLINAEEALLCAGFEKLLADVQNTSSGKNPKTLLGKGGWPAIVKGAQ